MKSSLGNPNHENKSLTQLNEAKQILESYHGATKLFNIPEFTSSQLLQNLNNSKLKLSLDQTVTSALSQIADNLSAESVVLQFIKFQQEIKKNNTFLSNKLPENQRIEFYKKGHTYAWLQIAFSPKEHYFIINPKRFKDKEEKRHNRSVFQNAIDTVVIDPSKVPSSSLETLDIQLDPDCQNLKEIFKKMYPLKYAIADEHKQSIRINEYQGKYIVFTPTKTVYKVDDINQVTQGEQRKEDISVQMGVYPDIFSIIRREEYIIDNASQKQSDYQDIKKKLIASIKEIDWNKKHYSVRVMKNVQEIINEIDAATSAKILADKLYHLYKITGRHSSNDKKHLEVSIRDFTQRIAQLIGISSYTQLHLLELNDKLEDQRLNLEMFHNQITMFVHEPSIKYNKFLLAFENYYNTQRLPLKEPFRTFDRQIKEFFGDLISLRQQDPQTIISQAEIFVALQKEYLQAYTLEHNYKEGLLSIDELQEKFNNSADYYSDGPYEELFADISQKRADFSVGFTKSQINKFFDELSNIKELEEKIIALKNL